MDDENQEQEHMMMYEVTSYKSGGVQTHTTEGHSTPSENLQCNRVPLQFKDHMKSKL